MKTIFKTLCALALIYCWMWSSEDGYQHAKKQEQLVASFWQADNGHYSGREE
jgi:hypothetical protein